MFETIKNCFKNKDIRRKIWITLLLLLVFRLGCYIPVPGIDVKTFGEAIKGQSFLNIMAALSGGSLSNATLFALGISPYINASIIVQLLSVGIPALERLSKQGEEGRKRIAQITRILTIVLAIAQAIGIIVNFGLRGSGDDIAIKLTFFGSNSAIGETGAKWLAGIFLTVVYTAGSMLVMWLGERITEIGVGNGISLLIFVGILSTAGISIVSVFTAWFDGNEMAPWSLLVFALFVLVIFAFIVFIDLAERKIPVHYAKQIKGRKQYGGQTSYIPIKVNASGVLPIIFSTAILSFPQLIMSMFNMDPASGFYAWWTKWLGVGQPIYSVLVGLLILFFSFFYAQIQFNAEEVARNIQQYGGNITGLRPGKMTSDYLKKINKRLTLFGAIFLAFIEIVPSIIFSLVFTGISASLVNAFSATGMLIVVSVALEFQKQLESQLMMKQYRGFLK